MNRLRLSLVAAVLSGLAVAYVAVDASSKDGIIANVFAATALSDAALQTRLQEQGYTNIQNLRHDGKRVSVTATKDGQTAELMVNPSTGQVRHGSDADDDDDD
jgi:Peptidase propeptide and YPEB domain